MNDILHRYHKQWLDMVQPVDGLVFSVPVLVDAFEREAWRAQTPTTELQRRLISITGGSDLAPDAERELSDLRLFLAEILSLTGDLFDTGEAISDELTTYVPEGRVTLRPTLALKQRTSESSAPARQRYSMLIWEVPHTIESLDRPETATSSEWAYPASAKFDRLLRDTGVPIGLLTNGKVIRLMYAPAGESTGSITFRLKDMASVDGRPILDAFVQLLSAGRFFTVSEDSTLPALLKASRRHQANVTTDLANQVREALEQLLGGFESAAERDGLALLEDAYERRVEGEDHLYGGLLTVLMRLVFLLYAEDAGLLPIESDAYQSSLSLLALFARLQEDAASFPDAMSRRFGAYSQLIALFRAVYLGVEQGELRMPARRGELFDPHAYPFLEGWGPAGAAPIADATARAAVNVPSVDDGTIHRVLERLLVLKGQRLSYRALDVEQIGSVYEGLMGFSVHRTASAAACVGKARVWIEASVVREIPAAQRAKRLQEEHGLEKSEATKLAAALGAAKNDDDVLRVLEAHAARGTQVASARRFVIQPGEERRRTSSHYTPRELSEPIVRRTLEPLFAVMGKIPASARILNLKVCDPAMGSGAFLVEACRYLGDRLVRAWTHEGVLKDIAAQHGDPVLHARRLVAQRCLYGVDKNEYAVGLAKLSLWLVTLAKDLPFTFLDHALRHGDSLVGLDFEQIRAFHWRPKEQLETVTREISSALDEAISLRQRILELAGDPEPVAQREKERLLWDAQDSLNRVRLIGDLIVGAYFAHDTDKAREAERIRRVVALTDWLEAGGEPDAALLEMQRETRARVPAFHWMAEFPEIFYAERPDPLDADQVNRAAFMDAFIGNPPFAGKNGITQANGDQYLDWLCATYAGAHGNADLSAYFFRRAASLLGAHGTLGLIATNTIAQGDTRNTGLKRIVADGARVYAATRSMAWPGNAAVSVSVVHAARGAVAAAQTTCLLDGANVACINSRLRAGVERPDPIALRWNASLSFQGSIVLGMGFTLTADERDALIKSNKRNAERIFPYLGGEEVNTSPTQAFDRYVINFGQLSLKEAEAWPDLLAILREKVKPERDRLKDNTDGLHRKKHWWQFGRYTPALFAAIAPLERCLVTAIVSKHSMVSFQPAARVFSHRLYVFPFERYTQFAILQSRIHEGWTWLLSSTLEDRLNYSASDCFETFPFPSAEPRTVFAELERIGEQLYEARASYMVETQQGLTKTYNALKNPHETDPRIVDLRRLHEAMDAAVLAAYGWSDIVVPPFCLDHEKQRARFDDEVIDRLFALNAQRTTEERSALPPKAPGKRTPKTKPKAKKASGSGPLFGDE